MTTAERLTYRIIPMGAVFALRAVHNAQMTGPDDAIELFYGYTYSGHPVARAAGLAAPDIDGGEDLHLGVAELQKTGTTPSTA